MLYTGSDDGCIKAWSLDLELLATWPAHPWVVHDLAGDEDTDTLYSCSMDGEIKSWSVTNPAQPHAPATAIQTVTSIIRGEMSKLNKCVKGPTGEGADLSGMGGAASLEHEPATVRRLVFRHGHLWAGDEMGSVCRAGEIIIGCIVTSIDTSGGLLTWPRVT